ncbi:hypothetical protein CXB51_008346 [Gossypium anomalum]|uniref:Tudor-knot domain-containing protein n=1 Tax=Gossypium anomalum TaxID=47600 RepID=A0A8J5ZAJ2_9ROSI|nr:hypothetical protein CXB51_008346 [Gossypium anomalum]
MGSIDTLTITENGSTQSHAAAAPADDNQRPLASSNGAPESEATKKRRSGILPLEVGTRVMCRWRDGKYHPVKVIERRKLQSAEPINRRLDEWVKLEQLDLDSVETVVDEKVEDKVNILLQCRTLHLCFLFVYHSRVF